MMVGKMVMVVRALFSGAKRPRYTSDVRQAVSWMARLLLLSAEISCGPRLVAMAIVLSHLPVPTVPLHGYA
jgi:hypothetical protein